MSSVSTPPDSPLTLESLIILAEFVKNPQYMDRIKELQAAQVASDDSAKAAADMLAQVKAAQAALDTDKAKFQADQLATADQNQQTHNALVAREGAVTAREQALNHSMEDWETQKAIEDEATAERAKTLDARADALNLKDAQIKQREDAVTAREVRVDKKEALIKQAEAL